MDSATARLGAAAGFAIAWGLVSTAAGAVVVGDGGAISGAGASAVDVVLQAVRLMLTAMTSRRREIKKRMTCLI
jgi:dihydrodipicolinate synthase/N-acetylneuraminate lyase